METAFPEVQVKATDCREERFSFYDLVDRISPRNAPAHRFMTLMRKMGARTLFEETLKKNSELEYERSAAEISSGKAADIRATRVTFFLSGSEGDPLQEKNFSNTSIVGYAVIL